ncbi:MAG: hypothetical protein K8U57_07120 [Planctomycetes bacterium]|nr:hypothetical protein [Planctomycetota bacterium]
MADMKNQIKSGIDASADRAKNFTDKAADTANAGKQEAHGLVDRVKEGANQLLDNAGNVAGQAREKVSEWAGEAGDAAKQAGNKVQAWAGDAYDATADKVGDFGKEVTSLIRKHPLPSLLIGFAVGMLVGRTARMI